MTLLERVKNICLTPATEWPVIEGEQTSPGSLISGYVVPLAAIGAVAGFVGGSLIGRTLPFVGTYRIPVATGLGLAIFGFVMAIVGVFLVSLIINALAPTFGGRQDSTQALKVAVYSYTPAWVAGALQILPMLGLLAIIGGLYGLYLLYLGLPRLMKCPPDKAVPYTAVVVVSAIVLSFVIAGVGAMIGGAGAFGAGALAGDSAGSDAEVEFDPDSPMGRLQELGRQMEERGREMEAAEKSGDADAQAAAALSSLGTLLGGGRRVEPVGIDAIKMFVPETFAGLPRTGVAGLMVAQAEATYSDGSGRRVDLEVSDTGGIGGLVGLASWAGVEGEREDDRSRERTAKQGDRIVREEVSKVGGPNEYAVVLGERFVVTATGTGVDLETLRRGVSSLDLEKLESLRDAGVQR